MMNGVRKTLVALALAWLLLIHYHERVYITRTLHKCSWPSAGPRIALLADPQLVDANTYPHNPALLNWFIRRLSDNYLSKHYKQLTRTLEPSTIFFLGDLFDGGREWGDARVWFDEYQRFNAIFDPRYTVGRRVVRSLPGNHDIGFGEEVVQDIRDRFRIHFGETSGFHFFNRGESVVVVLDTISLSSTNKRISLATWAFVNRVAARLADPHDAEFGAVKHVVLLTHVPLHRDPLAQPCLGPHRESPRPFPVSRGYQYQTVLDLRLSQELIAKLRPSLIFSGDDHDYCHVRHSPVVEEITVKTMSMTNGIKYPAIQLLVLGDEGPRTDICYLADPYYILTAYALAALLSLIVISLAVGGNAAYDARVTTATAFVLEKMLLHDPPIILPVKENEAYSRYWKPRILNWKQKIKETVRCALVLAVYVLAVLGVYYRMS